jgi:hypothetical protein
MDSADAGQAGPVEDGPLSPNLSLPHLAGELLRRRRRAAPGELARRLNGRGRAEEVSLPEFSWLLPDLAVGGRLQPGVVEVLASRFGIRRVVDVRAEEQDDPELLRVGGVGLLLLPTPDHHSLSEEMLWMGVRWVHGNASPHAPANRSSVPAQSPGRATAGATGVHTTPGHPLRHRGRGARAVRQQLRGRRRLAGGQGDSPGAHSLLSRSRRQSWSGGQTTSPHPLAASRPPGGGIRGLPAQRRRALLVGRGGVP